MDTTVQRAPRLALVHKTAGFAALTLISSLFAASLLVEIFGTAAQIATVKQGIVYALGVLIPLMAATGLSGRALARPHGALLRAKQRRMRLMALNAVLILIPLAVTLNILAQRHDFSLTFALLQALELLAGALNVTLMIRNIRDGCALAR